MLDGGQSPGTNDRGLQLSGLRRGDSQVDELAIQFVGGMILQENRHAAIIYHVLGLVSRLDFAMLAS